MTHFVLLLFLPHEHQTFDQRYYLFIYLFYWNKCLFVVDKEKVNSAFLAEWGRSLDDRSAGGTSLIRAAAIGSCDFINTSKWNTPAQNRRRHRGRDTDRQGDTEGNRERQVVRLPERIICRSRTAHNYFHWIPTEINEGETLVSEIISEIRHGSQPECKV